MAENVSFVKSFLGGVIDKESYRKLVSNLYFVYSAMEEEMEKNKNNPLLDAEGFRKHKPISERIYRALAMIIFIIVFILNHFLYMMKNLKN
jgi:heme oxygenase